MSGPKPDVLPVTPYPLDAYFSVKAFEFLILGLLSDNSRISLFSDATPPIMYFNDVLIALYVNFNCAAEISPLL